MKKISILVAHLGNGGAERVSVNLANELCKRNFQVSLIIFHKGEEEYSVNEKVEKVYLEKSISDCKTIIKIRNLKRELRRLQPDYVIELGFAIKYILVSGLLNKYKFILSMRNDPYLSQKNSKSIFKYFRNYYFRHATNVVFQTPDARDYFPKDIRDKGVIIPNPIKENLPLRYDGERKHIIVAFSRLNKQKNIPMMLDAFKLFLRECPDYHLEIYGRGEEENNLKEYAASISISDKVHFCGFNKNIHNEIIQDMMFISTSDYEGISNSMLEALAIGLPTICTDCPAGGARMFIRDGENGLLSKVGDAEMFSKKMVMLATEPEIREKLSKNAIKINDVLSSANITDLWETLLR